MQSNDINRHPYERSSRIALHRGFRRCCPACGNGNLFQGYLSVRDHCPSCHEAFTHQRVDDAPPYFTILIVAHIVVPAMLLLEQWAEPAEWIQMLIWIPLTLLLTLYLLPRIKGALVGLQWARRMHGFGTQVD